MDRWIVVHALAHQALHLQSLCACRPTDKLGHGPIIVDGAFTKLYCHWNVRSGHCFAEALGVSLHCISTYTPACNGCVSIVCINVVFV